MFACVKNDFHTEAGFEHEPEKYRPIIIPFVTVGEFHKTLAGRLARAFHVIRFSGARQGNVLSPLISNLLSYRQLKCLSALSAWVVIGELAACNIFKSSTVIRSGNRTEIGLKKGH